MKKSLFALAAVGAIAGTAQAQSSVTVYGVLDAGYVGANTRIANPGQTVNGVDGSKTGVTNSTASALTSGAESTGRLGFKGNEDLGGGLSAFFTYEVKMDPNGSQAIATALDQNRQSFVGIKKAGIGSAAIGTQYTTIFNAAAATDPGMLNNMMGNVIYDKGTGVNPSYSTNSTSNYNNFNGMTNNSSFTVRAQNMLSFATETFSGFQANGFVVLNNKNTNQSNVTNGATSSGYAASTGTTNSTGWGLGANYTWQKAYVTANFQQFTDKNPYEVGTLTSNQGQYLAGAPAQNGYAGQNLAGVNDKDNQQYYAATYDFGILKAYVQYINRKTMDANNPNNYVARTAQQIGVRSFVTPVIETWASVGTGKLTVSSAYTKSNTISGGGSNGQTIGSNAANFGGFQLGSNYWLSKRTNLYAIYGQERTSNQTFVGTNSTSYNSNNYAVGVRHTF
ncbi:porin [Polynucleobacter paneuropaeus]|nr:porin [Polynucleobacter paneuropaeus]